MLDPLQCQTIKVVCLLLNACVRHSISIKSPIITIRSVRIRRLLRNSLRLMISLSHSITKTLLKLIWCSNNINNSNSSNNSNNSNNFNNKANQTLRSKREAADTIEKRNLNVNNRLILKKVSRSQVSRHNTHAKDTSKSCIRKPCLYNIHTWKSPTVITARCHTIMVNRWKCQNMVTLHTTRLHQDTDLQVILTSECTHITVLSIWSCKATHHSWDNMVLQIHISSISCKCQCIHITKVWIMDLTLCALTSQWSIQLQTWLSHQVKNLISKGKIFMGNANTLVTLMLLVTRVLIQSKDHPIWVNTPKHWRAAMIPNSKLRPTDQGNLMNQQIKDLNLLSRNSRETPLSIKRKREINPSTVGLNVIATLMEIPATISCRHLSLTKTQKARVVASRWSDLIIWALAQTNLSTI